MSRTVELADGITANVADDVTPATMNALRTMACELRHREIHGWMSGEPLEIKDGVDYVNRDCKCASCGAKMPSAPWPTNSAKFVHRPSCGKCGSMMTYPIAP